MLMIVSWGGRAFAVEKHQEHEILKDFLDLQPPLDTTFTTGAVSAKHALP
jgi:hypothetical protein